MKKEIIIDFSAKDIKEIESFPDFYPVWSYPRIKDIHPRTWGYLINKEGVEFHFRFKNNEEIIKDLIEHYAIIQIRLSGIMNLFNNGGIKLIDFNDEINQIIKLCGTMIQSYNDKKADK